MQHFFHSCSYFFISHCSRIDLILMHYEWHISEVCCAVWGTNFSHNIRQEAVKYMVLFQFAYKLYRAKPCKNTGAPWSVMKVQKTRRGKNCLSPVTLAASVKNVASLPKSCTSSKKASINTFFELGNHTTFTCLVGREIGQIWASWLTKIMWK